MNVNTVEAFRANQAALEQSLESALTMDEASTAIRMAFERTAAALAQNESDEITRQREQAVLSVAKQSGTFLASVRADGRLVAQNQPDTERDKTKDPKQAAVIAGLILLAFLAVYEIINGKWMFALLAVISVLLMYIGRDQVKGQANQEPKWRAEGVAKVNPSAVVRAMEDMCHSIDVAISDLGMIEKEQTIRAAGGQEEALLDVMSALMEAKESGREDLLMETVGDAELTLHRLGIQAVRYSPDQSALFDLLPTLGEPRTVRPALVSGEHVLRRGVAAIRMQEVAR